MIKIYYSTAHSNRITKIKKIREGAWLNLVNTDHNDLNKIAKLTKLGIIDLQDSMDINELPRIERHKDSLIVFVRTPKDQSTVSDFLYTQSMTFVITSRYFITISPAENPAIKSIIKDGLTSATTQRARLLITLLLKIAQLYTVRIKEINNAVISRKKHIDSIKDSDIGALVKYEDILNQYIAALIPMRNVFENIMTGTYLDMYKDDEALFDDMINNIHQSVDICQVNLKSIRSLRESYQIVFTNRLNKVIQFLTAFTIIMTIPTIIASLYGMNVKLPLAESPFAFSYILLISAFIISLFLYIFYKKKWL
ncbi:hypothetical protein KKH39_03815 [Patescibacteria group bacterium]|nr:hypothetical protein [Patescibacteria group bacterium]